MSHLNEERLLELSSEFPDEISIQRERAGNNPWILIYYCRSEEVTLFEAGGFHERDRLLAACEMCKDVANNFPKEECSDVLSQIAERLKEDQKDGAAIKLYLMAISEKVTENLWLSLGKILLKNDLLLSALLCFIQINSPESDILIAEVIRLLGWPDQALAHLEEIEIKPHDDLLWHLIRSDALAGSGKYTEAVSEVESLLNGEINEVLLRYIRFAAAAGDGKRVLSVLPLIIKSLIPDEVEVILNSLSEKIWSIDNIKDMLFKGKIGELSKGDANIFLLQCILAYGQTLENCLKRISEFSTRTGATNETIWKVIAGYSYQEWCSFPKSDWLHKMKGKHAQVHRMGTALMRDAAGDARGLWTGATQGEVLRRLEEIGIAEDSVNKIIIAMRNSGLPGDDAAIWNPDSNAQRIVARILFGTHTLPEEVIPFIQQFFRKNGHVLNSLAKNRCHIKIPLCQNCIIQDFCTFFWYYHETQPDVNWDDHYIQESWYCEELGATRIRLGEYIQIAGIDQIFQVGRKFLYHYDRFIMYEMCIFNDIIANKPQIFRNSLDVRLITKNRKK